MNLSDNLLKPSGHIKVDIFRHGELIEQMDGQNLVVVGYRQILAKLMGGATTADWAITQIGVGTSAVAPVLGNTTLTGAFLKDVDTITYPSAQKVSFNFSLGTGDANGINISEFGLLSGNGTLFARKVRGAPLVKDSSISLTGYWVITFS